MNDHDIWTHKSVQRARYGEERSIPIQFINQPVDLYNVIEDKRNHRNYEDLESEYYEKLPDVVTKPQFSENTTKSSSLDSPPLPPMASTLQRLYYPSGKGSTFLYCTRRSKQTVCLLCLSALTIALISVFLWQLNGRNVQNTETSEEEDGHKIYDLTTQKLHHKTSPASRNNSPLQAQMFNETLITANNLATLLITKRKLCIFEVSTNEAEQSRIDFEKEHIEGARLLFFGNLSHSGIPVHPLQFQRLVRNLGVDQDCRIILYDKGQQVWSTYAYWIFRLFGQEKISLLDGGFVEWKFKARDQSNLYKIVDGSEDVVERLGNFKAGWTDNVISTFDDVIANFDSNKAEIVDAQREEEFNGQAEGAVFGHIRGAVNVPIDFIYDWQNNTWPHIPTHLALFKERGLTMTKPVIIYDGTSLRSSLVWFALQRLNIESSIYFGSWPEWLVRAPDTLKIIQKDMLGDE